MNKPRTAAEAKKMGWTVDRTGYPWVAYTGGRFMPDEWCHITTPRYVPPSSS